MQLIVLIHEKKMECINAETIVNYPLLKKNQTKLGNLYQYLQ